MAIKIHSIKTVKDARWWAGEIMDVFYLCIMISLATLAVYSVIEWKEKKAAPVPLITIEEYTQLVEDCDEQ